MTPKILLYDLEVSRTVAEGYGNRYDFRVIKFVRPQELMCYSYKWLGGKKTYFVSRHNFKTYKDFVQSLADTLGEADIAIAHNGASFDDKMSNRFYVVNGISPPAPFHSIDTKREAKRHFRFESNSLDDLGDFLGVGRKEKITYSDLEDDFMTAKPKQKTIRMMRKYNNQDVDLLERVYLKLRPYMTSHPGINIHSNDMEACPKCGGNQLQRRGTAKTKTQTYSRYQCQACGSWCRGRGSIDIQRVQYVN